MKIPFKWNRHSRLQVIQVYLIAILAFTFLFFCFSVVSFYREREKASRSNLELKAKQAIWNLENDIQDRAAACLSTPEVKDLLESRQPLSLERLRLLRDRFQHLRNKYPFAHCFFVFENDRVVFPRLESPPQQSVSALLASTPEKSRTMFSDLLKEGEGQERLGDATAAARAYEGAEKMSVSPRLKALAAFRRTEALRETGDQAASARAYRYLLDSYGDQCDLSQTPYFLSLSVGKDGASGVVPHSPRLLDTIYRDLVNGRWELSAEQAERFIAGLEKRLGITDGNRPDSDFLENFQLAQAVAKRISPGDLREISDITARTLRYRNKPCQVYLASVVGGKGRRFVAGFSVSLPWISNSILNLVGDKSAGGDSRTVSIVETSEIMDANDVYIPFSTILPSWRVRITGESLQLARPGVGGELWFIAVSTFMFFSILAVGFYLLIRVSWDIRWLQLRSDFVSGVSHEFKTPLSLIRLYSETLANDDEDFSQEERKTFIRIIARESERMSRQVENVLSFSRIEQGQYQDVHLQAGDIADAVKQTVDEYSEYLMLQGVDVRLSIQPHLPPVRFNREQIVRVILNLLENATKYSGASKRIRVNAWAQNGEVVVEVQDNGFGIPREELKKIFQPFYRAPKGSEKGGCGLGLYLVDQVMKEHDGKIEVESAVGKGSRFRLIFPMSGAADVHNVQKEGRSAMKA